MVTQKSFSDFLNYGVALLVLGGAGFAGYWLLGGSRDAAESPTESDGVPAAAALVPVEAVKTEEAFAAPRDGLRGVEARWIELNNEATLRLREGDIDQAAEMFERCYEALPERDVFRRNLAEALVRLARREYDERELEGALDYLSRALELAPEREDADALRELRERWMRETKLEENHWTRDSDLFELSYDTNRVDILRHDQDVLDHLEWAYEELRLWFARDPVREGRRGRIRVVLYNHEEFDRLTGLGDWAGGVFDGVVRVSVEELRAGDARWKRVLTHELVHAFLHVLGGNQVPGWLNEGLAQCLERAPGSVAEARERMRGHELFSLDRLQGSLASWSDADEIARAYAQSLLFVDYLIRVHGEEVLRLMVVGCAQGKEPAAVFEGREGVPLQFAHEAMVR